MRREQEEMCGCPSWACAGALYPADKPAAAVNAAVFIIIRRERPDFISLLPMNSSRIPRKPDALLGLMRSVSFLHHSRRTSPRFWNCPIANLELECAKMTMPNSEIRRSASGQRLPEWRVWTQVSFRCARGSLIIGRALARHSCP